MKRVQIFNYNFDEATDEELAKAKMKHGDLIEVENPLTIVNKLYKKTKLNIAIHGRENVTIFVTMYPRFSQR